MNVSDYIKLFRKIAYQNKALADSFYYGDSERIIGQKRSEIRYPVLWLESPNIAIDINTSVPYREFKGAFVILWNSATDDYDKQDKILEKTQEIAEQVIAYLRYESVNNELLEIGEQFNLQPLSTVMVDGDYGWRVECTIKYYLNQPCEVNTHFTLFMPDGITPNEPSAERWIPATITPPTIPLSIDADFNITWQHDRSLVIEDTTAYAENDTRDGVVFGVNDGTNTYIYNGHYVTITEQELNLFLSNNLIISMTIISKRGLPSQKIKTFIK